MGAHSETQYYKSFVDCLQPIENNPKIQRMKKTNTNIRYKQIQKMNEIQIQMQIQSTINKTLLKRSQCGIPSEIGFFLNVAKTRLEIDLHYQCSHDSYLDWQG